MIVPSGLAVFKVEWFQRLMASGFFADKEPLELLDGYLIQKWPEEPLHDEIRDRLRAALLGLGISSECLRAPGTVVLRESVLEPDLVLNTPEGNIALVVEVSAVALALDRTSKAAAYARNGIPTYGIVNIIERQVEWFRLAPTPPPHDGYGAGEVYRPGTSVLIEAGGHLLGALAVADLFL